MKRLLILNVRSTAKKRLLFVSLVVVLNLMAAYSANAQDVSPCGAGIVTERVTYFPISGTLTTNDTDPRVSPGDGRHRVNLKGSIHYKDPGRKTLSNRPVLIFIHGHAQTRPEACGVVKYFTDQNWVVFTPLRRGYSLDVGDNNDISDDISSTGIYIDDYVDSCNRSQHDAEFEGRLTHLYCGSSYCRNSMSCNTPNFRSAVEVDYLNQQRVDVREAIAYIKSRVAISHGRVNPSVKLADPKRIVILGHSYGGSLTVFANAFDYGQSVAIDVQGAELSWDNPEDAYWSVDLPNAMNDQQRPIYMFQPKNGRYLTPTKIMFGIAVDRNYRSRAEIFPPVPCSNQFDVDPVPPCNVPPDEEYKDAHGNFIGRESEIAKWGPAVVEFANRYPRN